MHHSHLSTRSSLLQKHPTHPPLRWSTKIRLVGGFNPLEKYSSNWIISAGKGENSKRLKPPLTQKILVRPGSFWLCDDILWDLCHTSGRAPVRSCYLPPVWGWSPVNLQTLRLTCLETNGFSCMKTVFPPSPQLNNNEQQSKQENTKKKKRYQLSKE